ncbi:MAG: AAA family ATPase [Candidatus Gastranaerophilales bacterium]|nr:AAA family ATPase [Candidatus Gastranaerophilales bacterium]
MTKTIAITGKSGSGKTTIVKAFMNLLKEYFPDKSILLFDNDLTCELGFTFGLDIRNTIYGIRAGKHEYKTGIPSKMTKQEYIEWALEDIVVKLDDNTDIIVSWLIASKDCRCPITKQINDALLKLISHYDFVIFDCEFDLKYLYQLVDTNIDLALIISKPHRNSIELAKRIYEFSSKYAYNGQIGVVLNNAKEPYKNDIYELLNECKLDVFGIIDHDENIDKSTKNSDKIKESLKNMYSRFNLPQNF